MNGAANPHCVGINVRFNNYECMLMIATTTHIDLHGMRMSKDSVEGMVQTIKQKYFPLQLNHDDSAKKLGVIVSAKSFEMPDGETALGAIVVIHSDEKVAEEFPDGAENMVFDEFNTAIDTKILMIAHDVKMLTYVEEVQTLEQSLESFLRSHIVMPDGQIRTNKHLIASTGDFNIVIYPKDHRPAHFHLISEQRGIDARISIDTLELIRMKQGKISNKDLKMIKLFFRTRPKVLKKMRSEALRLELEG